MARRVSGPLAARERVAPARQQSPTVGSRALAVVRSLPDHSLIDRLVRGRAWIPVLGVLLAGIVAMQVEILKLGTTLGRSIGRTATLQSHNEWLQAGIATLANDQRIERLAAGMGMVIPSPGLLTFVGAHPQHEIGRALANIHAPDSSGFAAELATEAATAALTAPAAATPTTGATGTPSSPATSANVASGSGVAGSSAPAQAASGPSASGTTGTASTPTGASGTTSTAANPPGTATAPSTVASPSSGAAGGSAGGAALPATAGSSTGG